MKKQNGYSGIAAIKMTAFFNHGGFHSVSKSAYRGVLESITSSFAVF